MMVTAIEQVQSAFHSLDERFQQWKDRRKWVLQSQLTLQRMPSLETTRTLQEVVAEKNEENAQLKRRLEEMEKQLQAQQKKQK